MTIIEKRKEKSKNERKIGVMVSSKGKVGKVMHRVTIGFHAVLVGRMLSHRAIHTPSVLTALGILLIYHMQD